MDQIPKKCFVCYRPVNRENNRVSFGESKILCLFLGLHPLSEFSMRLQELGSDSYCKYCTRMLMVSRSNALLADEMEKRMVSCKLDIETELQRAWRVSVLEQHLGNVALNQGTAHICAPWMFRDKEDQLRHDIVSALNVKALESVTGRILEPGRLLAAAHQNYQQNCPSPLDLSRFGAMRMGELPQINDLPPHTKQYHFNAIHRPTPIAMPMPINLHQMPMTGYQNDFQMPAGIYPGSGSGSSMIQPIATSGLHTIYPSVESGNLYPSSCVYEPPIPMPMSHFQVSASYASSPSTSTRSASCSYVPSSTMVDGSNNPYSPSSYVSDADAESTHHYSSPSSSYVSVSVSDAAATAATEMPNMVDVDVDMTRESFGTALNPNPTPELTGELELEAVDAGTGTGMTSRQKTLNYLKKCHQKTEARKKRYNNRIRAIKKRNAERKRKEKQEQQQEHNNGLSDAFFQNMLY